MRGSPGLTLLAAALGVMMVALDGTIVAVANPAIQSHLGASLADIQWVTNGYLLALAVTLITIGKIGDRFGHKKVFLTGIVGFAASSAAVGRLTIEHLFGLLVLRETPPSPAARSFDIPGIALLSGFLLLLVWALIKGASYGWGSSKTIGFFAAAVVALALFIVRERRAETPLLPLRLFRSVALSAGTVLTITLMFSLFGAMFFMTFFMENVHGLDPVATGVRLLPMTAMLIVGAPLAGLVITKIGPRVPMVAGMLIAAVALFGLSRIGLASSLNDTILWFALLGLGLSPVMVGATEVIVGNAPVELAGVASGLQSTAMQVGGTIGTAVLGAVMSAKVDSLLPARWAAAHLPALSPAQLAGVKSLTTVGVAPVQKGIPAHIAATIADVTHSTFISGMTAAFLVACVVAVGGALVALLTRRGRAEAGHSPAH
jgi:MFS family permease